jgi:hypothetical protein
MFLFLELSEALSGEPKLGLHESFGHKKIEDSDDGYDTLASVASKLAMEMGALCEEEEGDRDKKKLRKVTINYYKRRYHINCV